MTFGQEFKAARLRADMGLKEAARAIGRSLSTVQQIEAGLTVSERTRIQAEEWVKKNSPQAKEGG